MNNKIYHISTAKMQVKTFKQAPMLEKYGIEKPSDFEINQFNKFGLTDQLRGMIVTSSGIVLCNWEHVQVAKAEGVPEIEVTVIENLTDDEIPQLIALTNLRKRLKKTALAELIADFREYLTSNETGKIWSVEIPGNSIDDKIGTLVGYSYGMIAGYRKIYTHRPELLKMMDEGKMSFSGALQLIGEENNTCEGDETPIVPTKSKAPKHNYAGELNMVPCEPMESIQIRYSNGKTIDIHLQDSEAIANILGDEFASDYSYKKENFTGGAEFHRIGSGNENTYLQITVKKAA